MCRAEEYGPGEEMWGRWGVLCQMGESKASILMYTLSVSRVHSWLLAHCRVQDILSNLPASICGRLPKLLGDLGCLLFRVYESVSGKGV